jgi:hypothetical protein
MSGASKGPDLARRAIAAAVLLGVLADSLLRTGSGAGFTIWVLAVVAGAAALIAYRDGRIRREVLGWLTVAGAFALAFSWRDAEELQVFTVLAIVVALALARVVSVREPAPSVFESRAGDVLVGTWRLIIDFATGFLRLIFRDAPPWRRANGELPVARAALAIVAAAAVVFIFAALLAGADPVFAAWINIVRWDFDVIASHIVITAVFAWLVGGALRGGLFRWEAPARTHLLPRWSPGTLEVAAVLGGVVAVFALFIAAQFAWIAGGAGFVQTTTGLTFAEFARRGFFQLIVAAGLLLLILLAMRPSPDAGDEHARRWYRRLAYAQVALFAVVVISAAAKLRLYIEFYALSVPRLYAAAAIAWLAFVFLWFAATILRDRPRRFVAGGFISAFAVLALLYVANPDALVARYNLGNPPPREGGAKGIDYAYLARLSGDAVPVLVPAVLRQHVAGGDQSRIEQARPGDACVAAAILRDRWSRPANGDWRVWNASDARARRIVQQNAQQLSALSCPRLASARLGGD